MEKGEVLRIASAKDRRAIYSTLLEADLSKAQKRQFAIIEAAIKCYASVGVDRTTFDRIAQVGKMSRPIIQHYFKDKHEIFLRAVKYIRANFQQLAVDAILSKTNPKDQLEAYIRCTFDWIEDYSHHMKVWLLYFYYCGFDSELKELNTELVEMGTKRIAALIETGNEAGIFRSKSPAEHARLIQVNITGALISASTENIANRKKFADLIVRNAHDILGCKDEPLES